MRAGGCYSGPLWTYGRGWRPVAGYEPLEAIARNKVNPKRIETHWPAMLRVAESLITNQVRAYDLLRMFGREGHPTPLGQAFAEYGRIDKTTRLLALVDPVDDTYRRLMNRQLTVQESRHRLARAICHGGRGRIRQPYRGGTPATWTPPSPSSPLKDSPWGRTDEPPNGSGVQDQSSPSSMASGSRKGRRP